MQEKIEQMTIGQLATLIKCADRMTEVLDAADAECPCCKGWYMHTQACPVAEYISTRPLDL